MLRGRLLTTTKSTIFTRLCSSAALKEKWDLFSAVCVERKPQIVPEMTAMQKEFATQLQAIEFEKSYKSEHEVRHEKELKYQELIKKGDVDADVSVKETAQDLLDRGLDELGKFRFGPLITDADKKNIQNTVNRQLRKSLVLLTEQQVGDKKYYLLPQGLRNDGETLRQSAERILKEQFGSELTTQIYGNAPVGVYKYKYPKIARNSAVGAKVFIYFARYQSGEIQKPDHKWLTRQELQSVLPEKYHKSVSMFLIDE